MKCANARLLARLYACKRGVVIKKAPLLLGKFCISSEYMDKESRELFDLTGARVLRNKSRHEIIP